MMNEKKNAGHDMAIVGEPCNADANAKILALFINDLHMAAEYVQHHVRFVLSPGLQELLTQFYTE